MNKLAHQQGPGTRLLLLLAGLLLFTQSGFAYEARSDRHALIIGNSAYTIAPLANPANDAADLARKFRKMKYKVTVGLDQRSDELARTIEAFYSSVSGDNPITVFYYAGHAVQVDGVNYLLPVDEDIDSVETLVKSGYSLNRLLIEMKRAASEQNVIILDACRNNPLEVASLSGDGRGVKIQAGNDATRRMAERVREELRAGLAQVEAPAGTLVAYATEPGNVALDGRGRNGTYTRALLKHINRAETAEELFRRVRRDVLAATKRKQTPWEHSSLLEPFYFRQPRNQGIPDIVTF